MLRLRHGRPHQERGGMRGRPRHQRRPPHGPHSHSAIHSDERASSLGGRDGEAAGDIVRIQSKRGPCEGPEGDVLSRAGAKTTARGVLGYRSGVAAGRSDAGGSRPA
eukprot:9023064-Pyramimonas_sp.AAC.1